MSPSGDITLYLKDVNSSSPKANGYDRIERQDGRRLQPATTGAMDWLEAITALIPADRALQRFRAWSDQLGRPGLRLCSKMGK